MEMIERRKNERSTLISELFIRRLDKKDQEEIRVEVEDLSKSGVGFTCFEPLEIGGLYETDITIWTKEVIHAFMEVVRIEKIGSMYYYGAIFVGMPEMDASRIAVYQTVEREVKRN